MFKHGKVYDLNLEYQQKSLYALKKNHATYVLFKHLNESLQRSLQSVINYNLSTISKTWNATRISIFLINSSHL